MTIERGQPWGREVARPSDLIVARSDAEVVRSSVGDLRRPVGLAGGDLWASLGSPPPRDPVLELAVDGIRVDVDDAAEYLAVAHVVARGSWWRGPLIAAMNVDRLGPWNVAPRAHPNDGLVDLVEVSPSMSMRDRWSARGRLPTGTHVPHPSIATRRVDTASWHLDDPLELWIDGVGVGRVRRLSVTVLPDRFTVHA